MLKADTTVECEQYSRLDDREIIKKLKILDENYIKENYKYCLEVFIKSGHHEALEFFLDELIKKGIKFKDELNKKITEYNEFLINLKNKFRFKEMNYQKASPAIKWAQNKEFILLEIKFSHRHDAPGCPEVEQELFEIINGNRITFQAYCIQGDVPIKFEFDLTLYGEVVKLRSHWGTTSANKFHATLRKSIPDEWESLLKEGTLMPNNIQKWFEMDEKFKEKDNKKDEDEDDEENIEEEEEEIIQVKEKKKKRKTPKINSIFNN